MANLENEFILIAGSIYKKTEKAFVDRAHNFTRALTKSILDAEGGLVVYLAGEPLNESGDPLTFDWTVVYEAEKLSANYVPARQLKIITSDLAMREKMTEEKRKLIRRLGALKFAEIIYVEDDLITGGNIGDEQVEVATAMIALGGGKGVSDRARKMSKRKLPILPFDLQLGGFSDDGQGALGLRGNFLRDPLSMFPVTGEQVKRELDVLSLQEPIFGLNELAERSVSLFQAEREAEQASRTPDVLILTALSVELAAARLAFGIQDGTPHRRSANSIHFWTTVVEKPGGPVSCAVASLGSAGNVNAASITTQLLSELKPKMVLMMGIAAGMRTKTVLGEVVISERVVYYEGAAALADGVLAARPEMQKPGMSIQQDLSTYFSGGLLSERLQERATTLGFTMPVESPAGEVASKLKVSPATIASGEKLIRDPELFASLRSQHDKVCVAEMEAYGVVDACEKQNVPALVIRGISDFGDSSKDNTFHKVASEAAAIVAIDYITHGWSRT
ncbi:purine phosphorylase [Pseudomonas sp. RIT-PI-q]|uniref:phosphorylase family protein n=1 Tax=Pseudomonas sp. RIT-PI-q TaxID=1690247 RepID=UPI0006CD8A98|nr:5'-methylthioadenosine/S-adenosylhomocysteine nucleosidase [Pseudomonas sp. RIT-PI-q]KPG95939.1 purine phosphorylase [Pseudomonas sp. RIT-PI-q]